MYFHIYVLIAVIKKEFINLRVNQKSCKLKTEKRNCEIPKHDFLEKQSLVCYSIILIYYFIYDLS